MKDELVTLVRTVFKRPGGLRTLGDKKRQGWMRGHMSQVIYAISFYVDDITMIAIILFLNVYYLPGSVLSLMHMSI